MKKVKSGLNSKIAVWSVAINPELDECLEMPTNKFVREQLLRVYSDNFCSEDGYFEVKDGVRYALCLDICRSFDVELLESFYYLIDNKFIKDLVEFRGNAKPGIDDRETLSKEAL